MKVGIIGAGAWGNALGVLSKKAGNSVKLWDPYAVDADTREPKDLSDCEVWLIVVPGAYFRETVKKFKPFYNSQPVIVCTKGMEAVSSRFMTEILQEEMPESTEYCGILSGPQFAAEVARGVPTGSTLAGGSALQEAGKKALAGMYLEYSDDVLGLGICGTGKNAAALISGYYRESSAGENEWALCLYRAWREVATLGEALGAKKETFFELCGLGDLLLTATSLTSRNFSAGIALARKEEFKGTVEGIAAIHGLLARASKVGIEMSIFSEFVKKLADSE